MKQQTPSSLATVILVATFLSTVSAGRASQVSFLETFDVFPYLWVSTTEHAQLADWPNGDPSTARDNGALRVWGTFATHNPARPISSFKSIVMNRCGELRPGDALELRADILRLAGAGAYAALGWQDEALPEEGYVLLLGAADIALVKHRFDQQVFAPLFWESLATGGGPVTLVLRFIAAETGLSIEAQVRDVAGNGPVWFTRTITDTADREPVAAAPPPFQGSEDSGASWRGTGRACLSLFGGNTTGGRLEMDVDNFSLQQTSDVTEADSAPFTYSHAPNQALAYRLFAPSSLEPGALYPLVLHLHGREGVGDDNIRQFSRPGVLAFVSPANQLKHPCFMVSPQVSTKDANAVASQYPYTWAAIRQKVIGLLTNLLTELPIDPERVYVTGGSMGGIGTWSLITIYPEMFAAAVPVAGLGDIASMRKITHLPVWAFHGARDQTIAASFTQSLVTELRRLGATPIYTEYALASHVMFDLAYETPELVDWLLAQRRGVPVRHAPWIAVTTPAANGTWPTSATNITLAGEVSTGFGVTSVAWRNQASSRSGPASSTTPWAASDIPLRAGVVAGLAVNPATNLITITATGPSGSDLYGGATTFNTTLNVVQMPIQLRAAQNAAQVRLDWTGAAPSFVIQRCPDLGVADWTDWRATAENSAIFPPPETPEFYRIRLPVKQ